MMVRMTEKEGEFEKCWRKKGKGKEKGKRERE